jgi:glyoxylase-like metal-dependent hydrolase (beta-lactamase superfamily II)
MLRSHSSTLYGFYLPDQDVVFAPDMMFVNAIPPFGFPDWYYPGYIRALERLIALNAKHYVPSHFDNGKLVDLVAYRDMMVGFRETVSAELAQYDYDAASGANLRAVFTEVYPVLKKRYGHLHGFDAMFVSHFGGSAGGTYLGF